MAGGNSRYISQNDTHDVLIILRHVSPGSFVLSRPLCSQISSWLSEQKHASGHGIPLPEPPPPPCRK